MKKILTLFSALLTALSLSAGELTVADGTATNEYSPFYGWNADVVGTQCQTLYLKEDLSDLAGGAITGLKFYVSEEVVSWDAAGAEFEVSLAEVDESDFGSGVLSPDFDAVFTGIFAVENHELNIVFSESFSYSGEKNLLLEIKVNAKGKYAKGHFYGIDPDVQLSIMAYPGWTGPQTQKSYFTPKTTFFFSEATTTCPRPSQLTAAPTPDGAVLTWKGEEGSQYQYCIVAAGETPAGWQLLNQDVFAYTATGLIAGNAYDAYVRTYCSETEQSVEIKQTFTPACHAPAKIELAELTHNTATLSWTAVAGISQYQYLCVLKDSTPDWEGVEPKEVLNVTIDTLQPSTAYDFYVRSYFSASVQSEALKTTFTTNCVAYTLPYNETFDNSISLPACWEASNVTNANWTVYTFSDENTYSGYSLHFTGKNNYVATLKTPAVELSEKALLKFYWKNSSAASANIQISTNGGSTKTDLPNDLSSTCNSMTEKTIDLSAYEGETVILYFTASTSASSNRHIYMDELSIVTKPCSMPKQLKAEASSNGAVVTWKAGNDEAEWNLRYRAVGDEEWKEHTALTEAVDTLSGMAAATEYEVQVQASCSADKQSEWTASATFTPVCPVPSKLAVNVIEEDRAIVVWECTESVFHLQYKAADAAEWQTVDSIEAKNYELTNLESSSTYQVRVQTACGSAYTNAVSFTTRCAPLTDTIPYVVPMDSVAVGSMPECWFVLPRTAEVAVTLMNDSTHRLLIAGEQECWIVLPELNAELNGLTVSVTWSGSSLKDIGYLTAADEQTYEPMAEFSTMPAECDFRNAPAEAKYVAIHYVGTTEYSIGYIAQVQIAESAGETAIDTTSLRTEATKCLENGQLFIIRHGRKYNAQGTIVK